MKVGAAPAPAPLLAPAPPPRRAPPAAGGKRRPSPWAHPSTLAPGEVALVGVHTDDLPAPWGVEIAVAGRSNVGKSSAINRLLKRDGLARTSGTPGRTQTLNFFAVGGTGVLVDLPGYGFARVPDAVKARWAGFIESYLYRRENLSLVISLIDGSIPAQRIDTELIEALIEADVPLVVVATKMDRLSRTRRGPALEALAAAHGVPAIMGVSSVDGAGFEELRALVHDVWSGEDPYEDDEDDDDDE
ncbi:MAG: hypothetical protein RL071_2403 [Pseudomonadota bacterium]